MEGQTASNGHGLPMEVTCEGEPTRVKPAEETEKGLYYLSNIDQNLAVIMKSVYLYKASDTRGNEEAVEVARESLAKVLVPYHPLAGRLVVGEEGKLAVELTGEGVPFVVAQANFGLGELLGCGPHPDTLFKLVYDDGDGDHQGADPLQLPLMTIQVTKLRCGGFAVGMYVNHCMMDGLSAVNLVNSWGHVARHGLPLGSPPLLDRSLLRARRPPKAEFPHLEFLDIDDVSGPEALYGAEPLERRAFVFDGEMIGRLKGGANGGPSKCSSFEALAAFVWRARCRALGMSPDQRTRLLVPVDGRSRFNPPLPNAFFGNGVVFTCSICTAGELVEKPLSEGVKRVQDAIKMVTGEYMRSAIDYLETTRARLTLNASVLITTWSRLSFPAMDFGWGNAVYFGPVGLPWELVVFLPNPHDTKGVVVHLGLPASAMAAFHQLVMDI